MGLRVWGLGFRGYSDLGLQDLGLRISRVQGALGFLGPPPESAFRTSGGLVPQNRDVRVSGLGLRGAYEEADTTREREGLGFRV